MSRKKNLIRDKILSSVLKFVGGKDSKSRWETKGTTESVAHAMTPKNQGEHGRKRMEAAIKEVNELIRRYVRK